MKISGKYPQCLILLIAAVLVSITLGIAALSLVIISAYFHIPLLVIVAIFILVRLATI